MRKIIKNEKHVYKGNGEKTVETIKAKVRSPENRRSMREGRGFSLRELREAGLAIHDARRLGILVDGRRASLYPENVETLKKVSQKPIPKPSQKKAPAEKPKEAAKKQRQHLRKPHLKKNRS